MELRQLRHFLVLTEEMHFGRAAERLFISQPALSASILRLEDEFGFRLFNRDSKAVRITPAGQLMSQRAREMLAQEEKTHTYSKALADGRLGKIELGFSGTVLHRGIDKVINECRAEHPEILIVARELTTQTQNEMLRAGKIDAGLVSYPSAPPHFNYIELFADKFVACVPAGHRLADRKIIEFADLRLESFIFQSRDSAPSVHDQLVGLCASAGFEPQVAFFSSHTLSTISMVSKGLGVALVLDSLSRSEIDGIVFIDLNISILQRTGYFVWDEDREVPGLRQLISYVSSFADRNKLNHHRP